MSTAPRRTAHAKAILGPELHARLPETRVLLVGAGGIGCELCEYILVERLQTCSSMPLVKNIVLTGFGKITLLDLDTIDLSNLNRQFLFRKKDVKQSKALVRWIWTSSVAAGQFFCGSKLRTYILVTRYVHLDSDYRIFETIRPPSPMSMARVRYDLWRPTSVHLLSLPSFTLQYLGVTTLLMHIVSGCCSNSRPVQSQCENNTYLRQYQGATVWYPVVSGLWHCPQCAW